MSELVLGKDVEWTECDASCDEVEHRPKDLRVTQIIPKHCE